MILTNFRHPDMRLFQRQKGLNCICLRNSASGIIGYLLISLAISVLPLKQATAQEANRSTVTGSQQAGSVKSPRLNYTGVSYQPGTLRDPFLNPLLKKPGAGGDQEMDRGLPPPGIAGTFIEEAVLKGISISEDGRLAIVIGSGNRAYFLREGDRLFDGYLKVIYRDSIKLIRERKMRSGKIITQEVTKRLRTP